MTKKKTRIRDRITDSSPDSDIFNTKDEDLCDRSFIVVDDSIVPGGTKQRYMFDFLKLFRRNTKEWVHASPTYGYAQIAIAYAARDTHLKATLFLPKRKVPYRYTQMAIDVGANVVWVPMGYLSNCTAKAKQYVQETPGASLVPFGCDHDYVLRSISEYARRLTRSGRIKMPKEVWTAISSGTLSRGLQMAWPEAEFHGVVVGHQPTDEQRGRAILHYAPEKYDQKAKTMPPFNSCFNYDAKVWQFMHKMASEHSLFWNVAGS